MAQRNTTDPIFYPLGSRKNLLPGGRSSLLGHSSPSCELVSLALPKSLRSLTDERTKSLWGHRRVIYCEEQVQEARVTHL